MSTTKPLPGREKALRLIRGADDEVGISVVVTVHADGWFGRMSARAVLLGRAGTCYRVRLIEPLGALPAGSVGYPPLTSVSF